MKRILLLEDDEILNEGIRMSLQHENYDFHYCYQIAEAKKLLSEAAFDLLIIDVNLPDGNGFAFCREIRATSRVPVILLTARDMETDIVTGLESGADDYITKPFSLMVLRARIQALLRRLEPDFMGTAYCFDEFNFDFNKMCFLKREKMVELSKTEQKLLYHLVANAGQVLTRDMLLAKIWPEGTQYVEDNALSVAIRRLRDKLEDDSSRPNYIKTVYGLGYVWKR